MEKLIGVEWEAIVQGVGKRSMRARGVFLSVTYPEEYSANWGDWKRDLEVLRKRLSRTWPVSFGIWKEEFQERGAPHFHILMVFEEVVDLLEFRQWVSRAWYEVVSSGDPKHLAAGTNVRPLYGPVQRLLRYLSSIWVNWLSPMQRQAVSGGCGVDFPAMYWRRSHLDGRVG